MAPHCMLLTPQEKGIRPPFVEGLRSMTMALGGVNARFKRLDFIFSNFIVQAGRLDRGRYMHGVGIPFRNGDTLVTHDFMVHGGYERDAFRSEWCTIDDADGSVRCKVSNFLPCLSWYRQGFHRNLC